jgi:hypothetical protein
MPLKCINSQKIFGINYFRPISNVNVELVSDVSETLSVSVTMGWCEPLMMETERVAETSNTNSTWTRLIARQVLLVLCCRSESFI